ncbi:MULTISPECIES: NAD(P)/FAD-dependent oxidoreductase [Halolamina]|uniref:Thioredoxin reductase (NADPH) n=1 Tax=Halolamina pelagica TaxID=699431 RepID=A0A1I5N1F5_9EURY|nr:MULTISPECIES: NAD(P)/FAD-dependent oxidoreductase [Halolamina]NHX36245.1 NAD(P)/FAD-dependent oxidoreductase [Halolamina sp. R1-12]SFP15166.1 thioredoxin reductase (NADPH) [Halolamina pelagica]
MTEADPQYQVAVVGGGPAGLTTALYTTRLGHDTVLIDRGGGRAAMMQETHNVIGITEETSGNELLRTAKRQIESYGADTVRGMVSAIDGEVGGFELAVGDDSYTAERVVLATGFSDQRPDPPLPRTGRGLHYCLHCDAYMFIDESVYVMGHSESAAQVAMIMLNFTAEVDVLLRGEEPEWSEETDRQLRAHPIDVIDEEITGMNRGEDGWLESFEFADGTVREYRGGFPMYGSDYNADLVDALGVERTDGGAVAVDDHGRTSVKGVSAVGDLTPGHNQIPVAMGEGAKAGIGLHYDLREFPKSLEELDGGSVDPASTPAVSAEIREAARRRDESEAPTADD